MWCQIQIKSELILLYCIYVWTSSLSLSIKPRGSHLIVIMHKQNPNNKTLRVLFEQKKSRIRRMQIQSEKHHHRLPSTPRWHLLAPNQQGTGVGDEWCSLLALRFTFCQMGGRQMGNADVEDGELKIWTCLYIFVWHFWCFSHFFWETLISFSEFLPFFFWPVCIVPQNRG